MSYKLVAIDMDGTLLDDNQQVPEKNQAMIEKLADWGVDFVLASGRPYQSLHPYTEELEVYLPLISANGSIIRCTLTDKIYHESSMPLELAREVVEYGEKNGYSISLYYPDKIVTREQKMAQGHREKEGVKPEVVEKFAITTPPAKIIYHAVPAKIKKGVTYLSEKYEDQLYVTQSDDEYLEVMNLEVSKGEALKYMMERMDFAAEEVVAIGNNYNDVAMLKVAGLAVAMGNSPMGVKEAADFVTKSNQEAGVAYALEQIFLKNNWK